MQIDNTFDFRTGIKPGQDPDKYSKELREYNKVLWSKPLPNGKTFKLSDEVSGCYLSHQSELGQHYLSSDSISHSYIFVKRMAHIIEKLSEERKNEILNPLYTVGGFIIFPSNKINNKATINGARGLNARIVDRFDLTLECIRRHYSGENSPLGEVLRRYNSFFSLFADFRGYVDFFLLQDLVHNDYSDIKFLHPFDESWPTQPLPKTIDEYNLYISKTIEFVKARGQRQANFSFQ